MTASEPLMHMHGGCGSVEYAPGTGGLDGAPALPAVCEWVPVEGGEEWSRGGGGRVDKAGAS